MKNLIFYLGLATLFTHEIDAMPNQEWTVLPLVRTLPDDIGMVVFILAHIPLFALLIALVASTNRQTRKKSRLVISGFLVLHGGLHALFMHHPDYEFSSLLSNSLIFGAAVLGALYLGLEYWTRNEGPS